MMFGLDICNLAKLRKAEFDQIANAHTPIADLFREDLGNRYPGFLKKADATAFMWDSLAAAYLRMSVRTLLRYVKRREIAGSRTNGPYLFELSDLQDFMSRRRLKIR